jgi:hypothetical protein
VKQLRATGRRDDAAAVAALRRPSPAAWALNLAARRAPDDVAAVLAAGDDLRAASLGEPGAPSLREADAAHRAAAAALVATALRLAADAGGPTPADVRQKVGETLRAALADDEVADELRAGRLQADHVPAGFGLGLALPDTAPRTRPAPVKPARAAAGRDRAGAAAAPERRDEAAAERARAKLARARDALVARAEAARAALAAAEAGEATARDAARAARAEADERAAAARRAAAAAERADEEVERAGAAVARARAALAGTEADLGAAEQELARSTFSGRRRGD